MVGNVYEWVADWMPLSTTCGSWSSAVSSTGDYQCLTGGPNTTGEPSALLRGGDFFNGAFAGPFTVSGVSGPSFVNPLGNIGLRCTR